MSRLQLSEIWIYPIKSLSGVRVKQVTVLPKGLQYDRRWMLIDAGGRFLTQREHPKMAQLKQSITETFLIVTNSSNQESISIPLVKEYDIAKRRKAIIWNDEVEVFEVGNEFNLWFSKQLEIPCMLTFFAESNLRNVDQAYAKNHEQVSLADAYPILIIGQASLDDLNQKLKAPIPMNRFRPNFVFTGGNPYEEDSWRHFSIGRNNFSGVKNCARCVLTTVDQQTGIKGTEPLATLALYRKRENKILFGQNVLVLKGYEVNEGDEIKLQ